MQKILTLIFALYLCIGSSCAVKAEVLDFLNGDASIEYTKHAEKSGALQYTQVNEACSPSHQSLSKSDFTIAFTTQTPDFPGIVLSFIAVLFFGRIHYKRRRKPGDSFPYSKRYSPPLYLQFQRLQLYA